MAKSVIFDRLKCDNELKIRCKLNINEIRNALDLCLDNTYLCFPKTFYRQIFGIAMVSPISVIVANLVMESIENKMRKEFASPPRIWLRYIDDTFVVSKKTEVASFHKFIQGEHTKCRQNLVVKRLRLSLLIKGLKLINMSISK